jgi:hypothetical protein
MNDINSDIFNCLEEHILDESVINNHITQLSKLIINNYIKVRFHYEARNRTEGNIGFRMRSSLTKQILFANQ